MPYSPPKAHARKKTRRIDRRESAAARGYGHRWRKLRQMILARRPLYADCKKLGRVVLAEDVHHIVARRDGGKDEESNLEALCHSCHSKRTARGE